MLLLAASAVAAWLPFLATYVPPTSGAAPELPTLIARLPVVSSLIAAVGLHRGERTSVIEYLTDLRRALCLRCRPRAVRRGALLEFVSAVSCR